MPRAHIDLKQHGITVGRDGIVRARGGAVIGQVVKVNPTENVSPWRAFDASGNLIIPDGGGEFSGQREAAKVIAEKAGVW